MTAAPAHFFVGDIPIYGDVILAPMAAISDVPYRAICRGFGSAMNYTEFVAADALLAPENPQWRRLDAAPDEQPLVFQIFGNDAQKLLAAAQKIESWGAHIIDINMGCSVPRVSEHGAGVGMMREPKLVAETFSLLSKHLSVPVTGKIRLGWDDQQRNYLEIAHIMQDNGAQLIAMHGRTREQKYGNSADWDAIARLKQAVSIPVIGNGDVSVSADIDKMLQYTGCDAVMIGRSAIGNPWLFSRRNRADIPVAQRFAVIYDHLAKMIAYYGEPTALRLFRRHLRKYLAGLPAKPIFRDLNKSLDNAEKYRAILRAGEASIDVFHLEKSARHGA